MPGAVGPGQSKMTEAGKPAAPAAASTLQPAASPVGALRGYLNTPEGIPLAILVLLLSLFSILSIPGVVQGFYFLFDVKGNFSLRTPVSILNGSVLTGTIVLTVVMLMINGEFDLSVGAVLAMGGYIFGTLSVGDSTLFSFIEVGTPLPSLLALIVALAGCALLGVVNGLIVTTARIPSFIATLGTLFIFLWLVSLYSGNQSFEATREEMQRVSLYTVFSGRLRDFSDGISGPLRNLRVSVFWMVALAVVMQVVLARTRFGNQIFAVGGNVQAAKAQGINVKRIKIAGFALTGMFAGFAGVVLFSQFGRVQGNSGTQQELFAIAAAVVGGALLTGGYGSVIGGLVGILTISTLRSGVVLLSTPIQNSFIGEIPVIGIYLVRLTASDNFLTIIGLTIVGAAVLNSFIRRRL